MSRRSLARPAYARVASYGGVGVRRSAEREGGKRKSGSHTFGMVTVGLQCASLWRTMPADATGEPAMNESAQRIVVVDLRIPFARLLVFFIKAALAAIPAAIVVGFLLMLVAGFIAAFLGDAGFIMMRRGSL